jgi:hypothetical protein
MFAASRNFSPGPLNWNRFTTNGGEILTPFAHYVQRDTTHVTNTNFPPFLQLPRELQLRIVHFCDEATLFQLMHTSSVVRSDAKKLFWSNPNAWYHVSGEWLLAGGFTGHTPYAVDFLCNVQRVEIHFENIDSFFDDWIDGERKLLYDEEQPARTLDEQIEDLWCLLGTLCPRLTHVVVSESACRQAMRDALKTLVEKCPAPISVTASYLQRTLPGFNVKRHRVKKASTNNGTTIHWPILDRNWTRQIILLPLKEFRGPVGAFQRTYHALEIWGYRLDSLRLLCVEVIEKHHFGTEYRAFNCPKPGCPAYFTLPGQWPAHVDVSDGHEFEAPVPPEYAIRIAENKEEVRRTYYRDRWDAIDAMRAQWGEDGSEQRRAVEHAFLQQIEQDPLYACSKPAKETVLWRDYQMYMKYGQAYPY